MIFNGYFTKVSEGIEFIIALGSIIGLLGLVIGLLMLLLGGGSYRHYALKLIIIGLILVSICGLRTGTKFFRI